MRHRGVRRDAPGVEDPRRGARSPGVPRVRLGRVSPSPTARPCARRRPSGASTTCGPRSVTTPGPARSASPTPAGPPTASRASATPTRTSLDGPAIVHNGIVENAEELRAKLIADGVVFASDTDTEVLAPPDREGLGGRRVPPSLEEAVREALRVVEGTYGLVVLDARRPEELVVARNGSPIVLGLGDGEMFVASDVAALVRHTRQVVFLADGELATDHRDGLRGVTAQPADHGRRRRRRLRPRRPPRLPLQGYSRAARGAAPASSPAASTPASRRPAWTGCASTPASCGDSAA